jgi:hypothetical protein
MCLDQIIAFFIARKIMQDPVIQKDMANVQEAMSHMDDIVEKLRRNGITADDPPKLMNRSKKQNKKVKKENTK